MASGKTYWWAMDAAWLDRENIVELCDEFGPGGPLVIVALCGMAKLENDAGNVLTGYRTLARKTGVEADIVRRIVARATALGVLDDLQFLEDGRRFECRISGWKADQEKGRASERKAKQRKSRSVTPSHASSRSVTDGHAPVGDRTAQDRTEQPIPPDGEIGLHDVAQQTQGENADVGQPNLSVIEGRTA